MEPIVWTAIILNGAPHLLYYGGDITWYWCRDFMPDKFAHEWYDAVTRQGGYAEVIGG